MAKTIEGVKGKIHAEGKVEFGNWTIFISHKLEANKVLYKGKEFPGVSKLTITINYGVLPTMSLGMVPVVDQQEES